MKNLLLILFVVFTSCQQKRTSTKLNPINPILGDISFTAKFGKAPQAKSNEQTRIQTHLLYVENLLRNKSNAHLTAEQKKSRIILLDHLKKYAHAGRFPKNYDYPDERRPCFIDKDGNICAVGYLVEQSVGLAAAEEINSLFQYATIQEMKSDLLDHWIANSGLSKNEVAMIQPNYANPRNDNYIGYQYGVPTTILSLTNIGLSTASIANWNNPEYSKNYARIGIVTGVLSLGFDAVYGVGNIHTAKTDYQKTLRNVNLISGVLAIGVNGFRLLNYKKRNDHAVRWNINMQPGLNNQPAIGLVLNKKL